jgi:hypothetical protein
VASGQRKRLVGSGTVALGERRWPPTGRCAETTPTARRSPALAWAGFSPPAPTARRPRTVADRPSESVVAFALESLAAFARKTHPCEEGGGNQRGFPRVAARRENRDTPSRAGSVERLAESSGSRTPSPFGLSGLAATSPRSSQGIGLRWVHRLWFGESREPLLPGAGLSLLLVSR